MKETTDHVRNSGGGENHQPIVHEEHKLLLLSSLSVNRLSNATMPYHIEVSNSRVLKYVSSQCSHVYLSLLACF